MNAPTGITGTDGAGTLEQRFWAGYCDFLCMLNGYENFARFLEKYAPLVPAWERALRAAAENYRAAGVSSGALWEYVKPDGSDLSKFLDRDVRYASRPICCVRKYIRFAPQSAWKVF